MGLRSLQVGDLFRTEEVAKPLFRDRSLRSDFPKQQYDVSEDGQRFLLIREVRDESGPPLTIRVVQELYEEFRDREQD